MGFQEIVREVPKVIVQEVIRQVPVPQVQIAERIVEVPELQVQERVVEVPQIQTVERVVQPQPVVVQQPSPQCRLHLSSTRHLSPQLLPLPPPLHPPWLVAMVAMVASLAQAPFQPQFSEGLQRSVKAA